MAGTINTATVAVETRPGWKTTEFWVLVLGLVVTTLQEAVGIFNISDPTVLKVQAVLIAAYSIARGLAKAGVPNVVPVAPSVTTTSSLPTSEQVAP